MNLGNDLSPPRSPNLGQDRPPLSLSLPETCRALGMNRKVVRRMLRAGKLLGFRGAGSNSRIRVTWDSLSAVLKGRAL